MTGRGLPVITDRLDRGQGARMHVRQAIGREGGTAENPRASRVFPPQYGGELSHFPTASLGQLV